MRELIDFYNHGFGWVCRHCERDLLIKNKVSSDLLRSFREGEDERRPQLANIALAKWADPIQRILTCPKCGITEDTEKH